MTLYQRIVLFCNQQAKPIPSPKDRTDLGVTVSQYIPKKGAAHSIEDGRSILVNEYPEESYPAIDFIIQRFFNNGNI